MKISVITATYNSAKTVRDTFESVLSQTHTDIEYLIIDGGSTDGTIDIIRQYESRFGGRMRWISEPDHGIYDAMNKGIARATGDVVGILNSDDFYAANDVLENIAKAIASYDAVCSDLDFVSPENTGKVVRHWQGSPYFSGAFFKGWHPAHPTFYARKKCFDEFGLFDLSFDVSADFELMLRFIEKNHISVAYLPMTTIKMRYGGESTGSISKIITGNRNVIRAFKKNGFKTPSFYLVRRLWPKVVNTIKTKLKQ